MTRTWRMWRKKPILCIFKLWVMFMATTFIRQWQPWFPVHHEVHPLHSLNVLSACLLEQRCIVSTPAGMGRRTAIIWVGDSLKLRPLRNRPKMFIGCCCMAIEYSGSRNGHWLLVNLGWFSCDFPMISHRFSYGFVLIQALLGLESPAGAPSLQGLIYLPCLSHLPLGQKNLAEKPGTTHGQWHRDIALCPHICIYVYMYIYILYIYTRQLDSARNRVWYWIHLFKKWVFHIGGWDSGILFVSLCFYEAIGAVVIAKWPAQN